MHEMPARPFISPWLGRDGSRIAKSLTRRAQTLRRDPTPAEKKLWYEFLRDLPQKFTRQKPLGQYVADFYFPRDQIHEHGGRGQRRSGVWCGDRGAWENAAKV